jgi:histidine triad (HIT) family protein
MEECLFCKIVKGEIPSFKIFENDRVFSFLDINPLTKGHTLVIPKKHYENIFDIPEDELKEIISVAKKLSEIIRKKLNADGVNLMNASGEAAEQSVNHFHLHIVSRYKNDGLEMNKWWQSKVSKIDIEQCLKELA